MPGGKQHAATTALVLDVLERVHDVRNAAQADDAAQDKSPGAKISVLVGSPFEEMGIAGLDSLCRVTDFVADVGHGPLSASRAVSGCRAPVQAGYRSSVLVDGSSGLLLRGHARVLDVLLRLLLKLLLRDASRLRRHVAALRLLWWRRASILHMLRRLLVHLVLLHVRVRILVNRGLLVCVGIGRDGVLVDGN